MFLTVQTMARTLDISISPHCQKLRLTENCTYVGIWRGGLDIIPPQMPDMAAIVDNDGKIIP